MKSFAHFTGNCSFILFFSLGLVGASPAWAFQEEINEYKKPILIATGAIAGTYLISQTHDGPALFAGLYSLGTLYLMNEWYAKEKDLTDLIVPFGLLTLGVLNITLLRDHETYSKNDVFIYNLVGLSLLSTYAIWEHNQKTAPHSSYTQIAPLVTDKYSGVLFSRSF